MNNQVFLYELKINFNLREPKKMKETPIYAVVYINKKQYKISTGVKVLPAHWNKKRQIAIVNNSISKLEISNNNVVNKRIFEIKFAFQDFCTYFCENPNLNKISQTLKTFFNMSKRNNKNLYATGLLTIAFDLLYKNNEDGTTRTNRSRLKIIKEWVTKYTSNESTILNQKTFNKFVKYEKERGIGVQKINDDCGLFKRLINQSTQEEYYCHLVEPVKYIRIEDLRNRKEEEYKTKKSDLTNEEIEALKNIKLDDELNEYRDILMLSIQVGQRISDIHKIFKSDVDIKNIINIDTQKEGITAYIRYENAKDILNKYKKNGFKYIKFNKSFYQKYNDNIKKIAKEAGLNRIIKFYDPKDLSATKIIEKPLYELLSTHYARHTFITKELRKGLSDESIALQSGHKSKESLKTYKHIKPSEKIEKMLDEYENINREKITDSKDKMGEITKNIIEENKEVLLMLGANPYKIWEMKNADEIRKLLSEYEHKIMLEIDSMELDPIKDIFNERISLEERIDKINLLKYKRKKLLRKE